MSEVPGELKYTKSHEWVRIEADGSVVVGITDHAQDQLGDMVYVEAPEAGTSFAAGDACAVVESVKAASDVYAPISGEVTEGNDALADSPELVNQDPFGDGWLMKLNPSDSSELDGLMDAEAYQAYLESEEH
ncbi:glycine cleavage system protein GcvH [Thiohalobacter thiocyanaticus]|uniref:Glycine cleavage system H protein n=1 Tax=Thiohalobacter thiocyanaticus TaxID=585455 RepID=A0A426QKL3_9GAMM|nr:glycine cleavage system protein GcvH [Thiohalobacter thiocyanaticus]RRQ22303.1 glycine cleavage system protein GcvH [Thiohalobacter thiocyanaticus]